MKKLLYILLLLTCLTGCEYRLTDDPAARLTFSADTLSLDTVFNQAATRMMQLKVYNRQKEALCINSIRLESGDYFMVNADGETDLSQVRDILLAGGDSLYIFIKANIAHQTDNTPVLIEDKLIFVCNNRTQQVVLRAYGQNVTVLRHRFYSEPVQLNAAMPYHVFDTLLFAGDLTIEPGAVFYMHERSVIFCLGNVTIKGTPDRPVLFRGDRLDNLFSSVPYDYVSGNWTGIYLLQQEGEAARSYRLENVNIHSAAVGLYCQALPEADRSTLCLLNSVVYNMSAYGVAVLNMDALIANCEISNCATYCVYLSGGTHTLLHNTIASYFNNKVAPAMHNVGHADVAAVFINNVSKQMAHTETYMHNNIIAGVRRNNLVLATPLPLRYNGSFTHNYLQNDTLNYPQFRDNTYGTAADTVFVSTLFTSADSTYYNFRLDSVSPARGIADTAVTRLYPLDRLGNDRFADTAPDAGCYEWTPRPE